MDRLKDITLPRLDDVEDELQHYLEAKSRANEIESKIAEIGVIIDQIVYSLYDLTEEKIAIVEDSVGD